MRGTEIHRARWCRPEGPGRSRVGSLVDRVVKLAKQKEQAAQLDHVYINGHQIDNVIQFDYLGCRLSADGKEYAEVSYRMAIAQGHCKTLWNICV